MAVTRLRIRVGNNWYNVEISDLGQSPIKVTVDDETYSVDIESPSPQSRSRPRRGRVAPPGIEIPPPSQRTVASSAADNVIRSPMPGRVISISVRPGEQVTDGQELCVIEAMKMEQSVRASRDGVVKEILVQPTDSVRTNDPLMELE